MIIILVCRIELDFLNFLEKLRNEISLAMNDSRNKALEPILLGIWLLPIIDEWYSKVEYAIQTTKFILISDEKTKVTINI